MALIGLAVMVVGLVLSHYVDLMLSEPVFLAGSFMLTWGVWLAFLAKVDPTGRIPIGFLGSGRLFPVLRKKEVSRPFQPPPVIDQSPVASYDGQRFCSYCGSQLTFGAQFCPSCEKKLR